MVKPQEKAVSTNWLMRPEPIVALGSLCMAVLMISYFVRIPGVMNLSSTFSTWITSLEWYAILVALSPKSNATLGTFWPEEASGFT